MFKIGDKVVCPMRGCGVIENIEEKTLLDKPQEYFIIKIFRNNMTIMIPTSKIDGLRYRLISSPATIENALCILKKGTSTDPQIVPLKQRLKDNTTKINTGDLDAYAEVVCDLMAIQKIKALNTSEQAMLMNSRKFLAEEISIAQNVTEEEILDLLDLTLKA